MFNRSNAGIAIAIKGNYNTLEKPKQTQINFTNNGCS